MKDMREYTIPEITTVLSKAFEESCGCPPDGNQALEIIEMSIKMFYKIHLREF